MVNLAPQNTSFLVWLGLLGIWLAVYFALLTDIFADKRNGIVAKLAWIIILTGLPLLGGFLYGVKGLISADWSATLGGLLKPKTGNARAAKKKRHSADASRSGNSHPHRQS